MEDNRLTNRCTEWQRTGGPIAAQSGEQQVDPSLHRVANEEREGGGGGGGEGGEIKGTTTQKMARRHGQEEGQQKALYIPQ